MPNTANTIWSAYATCETCRQGDGEPCVHLHSKLPIRRPHHGRVQQKGSHRGRPAIGGRIRQQLGDQLKRRVDQWAAERGVPRAAAVRQLLDCALNADAPVNGANQHRKMPA